VPLRVKLVAAAVALVTAALLVIGVASAVALRSYLIGRIDTQLFEATHSIDASAMPREPTVVLPSDYLVRFQNSHGVGPPPLADPRLTAGDLPPIPDEPDEIIEKLNHPYTKSAVNGSLRWRVLMTLQPNGLYLIVGHKLTEVDSALDRLIAIELVVGGAVLAVLAVAGAGMVRASLRPLAQIEHTAAAIAKGDLTRRVPEPDPRTELGRLAGALNAMLAQIEGAFTARATSESRARRSEERMRQFVADASHELRTPLTTIRGFAELYRQGAATEPDEIKGLLKRIEDEAARMGLLVEDLLLLARMDQDRPLALAPVPLRMVAEDAVAAARAVAPDRQISLVGDESEEAVVLGDETRLRQVVGNLMTNAITHTPAGTSVTLRISASDAEAVLDVTDAGPGLLPQQSERVFERFYRVDKSRTRRAAATGSRHSGTGLGLAIVASLVAAHGGTVSVDSSPGAGATFTVRLPLLSETSQPKPSQPQDQAGNVEA